MLREFKENPARGYRPVGFIDDLSTLWGRRINGVPVLGGTGDLNRLLGRNGIEEVILSSDNIPPPQVEAAAAACRAHGVQLRRFQTVLEPVEEPARRGRGTKL